MERLIQSIYNVVWCPALIAVLVGAGLYFTVRTRCVQVRRVGLMVKLLVTKSSDGGLSSFQAFCVALSGRVGTGNIVGVATAIAIGGPGAVFWMWLIAFIGASTAFMEATLSQTYRFKHGNEWRGGPFCYIEQGLGSRWLAIIFAIFIIIGYGSLLAMVQSNSLATAFHNSFSIHPAVTGIVAILLLACIVVGGSKRIATVAKVVTPFMAIAYVIMAIIIVVVNMDAIPEVFRQIFRGAFGIGAATGGMVGSAIAMGVKRGLFSNEAGQGGGAIVAASAGVPHPAQQGLVQAFSVYIDTILVCTATAVMILCTGSNLLDFGDNYVAYTQAAVDTVFHGFGGTFVSIALAFFTFTTVMAYYFYSESSILYLCRSWKIQSTRTERAIIQVYRVVLFTSLLLGACTNSGLVWTIGDIGLGLTTWINVIVLIILCPQALKALKEYESDVKPSTGRRGKR